MMTHERKMARILSFQQMGVNDSFEFFSPKLAHHLHYISLAEGRAKARQN